MIKLLHRIQEAGIILKLVEGELKSFSDKEKIDPSIIQEIRNHKEEIISYLHKMKLANIQNKDFVSIPVLDKSDKYVVSSGQSRLWTLSQTNEGSLSYNMPFRKQLEGVYDVNKLELSIQGVISRHEILRTNFKEEEGVLYQYVLEDISFNLGYEDYRDSSNPSAEVSHYISMDNAKEFDLSNEPLLRVCLFRTGSTSYELYYNLHHIISDGWSMELLIKEVLLNYESLSEGKEIENTDLDIHYKDYSSWQQTELLSESYLESREYWHKVLSGSLPVLDLPSSKSRPVIKNYEGKHLRLNFSLEESQSIRGISKNLGGSLYMVLQSLVTLILHKYSGEKEIVLGSVVSGRDHPDLMDQIGFYVNTLVYRNKVSESESYRLYYEGLKEKITESYRHQMYPFDALLEDLDVSHDPSRNALFDVMMVLQNSGMELEQGSSLEKAAAGVINLGNSLSKFDIEFVFQELGNGGLILDLIYNPLVYDSWLMKSMLLHMQVLSTSIVSSYDTSIGDLEYLTGLEKEELIYGFNDTDTAYPKDRDLVSLFKEQVEKNPDSIALVYEEKEFTYLELDELSNRFSIYLQHRYDIKQGDHIGIRLSKSEWSIISILGVLYSGCVYVPIDVDYPEDRIVYMEVDSGCKVTITEEVLNNFSSYKGVLSKELKVDNLPSESLAYIMYTSGSTGAPKGVKISHDNIISLVKNSGYYKFSSSDVLLSTGSYSFDATTFEYWGMLLNGGRLIISSRSTLLDKSILLSVVKKHKVNVMWLTSGYANHLIKESIALFSGLSTVLIGGDVLSHKHIKMIRDTYPSLVIINGYGPTENTTFSLTHRIEEEVPLSIPIGKPLNNREVYILNESQKLQGKGITGEIYLGGSGLSQGYLNKEELTTAQFVAHPYILGKTLYKTGDLGFWDEVGNVHYVGRKDTQVKLRGYRIELGEIERSLQSHKDIADAVVLLHTDDSSLEQELVCYLQATVKIDIKILRRHLLSELPHYMIPNYFIPVSEFPLTPNGKVDRKELLKIELTASFLGQVYLAPRNDVEKKLVSIWEEVLTLYKIGIEDDFFELGGHSIKATRLLNRYRQEFGVHLDLEQLFHHTSLISHVGLLSNSEKEAKNSIPVLEYSDRYVVSSGQSRLWTLSQITKGALSYNMPFREQLEGDYDVEILERSILQVIARHEILRTVFKEEAGVLYQYVLDSIPFNLEYEDYREALNPSSLVSEYISIDNGKGFDLSKGPLLRGCLFRTGATSYEFYYNLHHIISDGWSMELLIKEVLLNYQSFLEEKDLELPALGIHYKDYSSWQQSELLSESQSKSKSYWHNILSGSLPVLDLPSSKLRPAIKSHQGSHLQLHFSLNQSESIRKISKDLGGSLYMVLQSLVTLILHKYSGEKEIVLGSIVSGRDHPDLMDQIGLYINTLVYRNTVSETESYRLYYESLKDEITESYNHQMYPFDALLEDLDVSHDPSRNALFDVLIVFQNSEMELEQGNSLRRTFSEIIELGNSVSKFDIEFVFQDLGNGGLILNLIYNSEIYDSWLMKNMLLHLQTLSSSIVSSYDRSIEDLEYLTESEKKELLYDFNDTQVDYPKDKSLVYLFKEQVLKSPDSVALIYEENEFTYSELDELSSRFSIYLQNNYDINKGDYIGILLPKSEWSIISILGVLYSGCVYVPLDIDYPEERIAYMETDSSCKLTITEVVLSNFLAGKEEFKLEDFKLADFLSASLAYIMYTSGSTGAPKGVKISHDNIISLVKNSGYYKFSSSDVLLSTGSYSFDATTFEYWGMLLNGGRLIISSRSTLLDESVLLSVVKEHKVNVMWLTSGYANHLIQRSIALFSGLSTVLIGGDVLSYQHINMIRAAYPSLVIINGYGPTENTTFSLTHRIEDEVPFSIPIGKPLNNRQVYILNKSHQLVGKGVKGEIYLGGRGLSKGYLNNEELTLERFIKHPYIEGKLLYKTGDLGLWDEQGNVHYLGRDDNQVKLRGYRIELGEIERSLQSHEEVIDAIVLLRRDSSSGKDLVCYVQVEERTVIKVLRGYLLSDLPHYMVPNYFIPVDEFPLTPNGKVDKKALLEIELKEAFSGQKYIAPRNEVEKKLVVIWEDILSIDNVGVEEDFFQLGGHSLNIISMLSEINKEFNLDIKFDTIFEIRTIAELGQLIENLMWSKQEEQTKVVDKIKI